MDGKSALFAAIKKQVAHISPLPTITGHEVRDWTVADQHAYEHFVTLTIETPSPFRSVASDALEATVKALDNSQFLIDGHRLNGIRLVFTALNRNIKTNNYEALARFRVATTPTEGGA